MTEQTLLWHLIEILPPDGSAVQFYYNDMVWRDCDGVPVSFGSLRDHVERFENGWFENGRWYESGTGHDVFEDWRQPEQCPTHWRLLPDKPKDVI